MKLFIRIKKKLRSSKLLVTGMMLLLLAAGLVSAQDAAERPAWQSFELTDALSGETFTLGGFEGRTVFVEPMATWCSNCRRQLRNVRAAKAALDGSAPGEYVFVMLSIEGRLSDDDLAAYAGRQGFDFVSAVVSPELLTALVAEFGRAITSPPSTPHFIIRSDGSTTSLVTGIEPAAAIQAQVVQAADGR